MDRRAFFRNTAGLGLSLAAPGLSPLPAATAEPYDRGLPDMLGAWLAKHLNGLAAEWDKKRLAIRTPAQIEARNRFVRQKVVEMIGGLPERTPLSPKIVKVTERPGYRIENLMFQSRPDFWVTGNLRLPTKVWYWMLRLAWLTGQASQRACRDEFQQRMHAVADRLGGLERDTLVVSHAGMMVYLSRELRQRGFVGPKLSVAEHARAYVYTRE